MKGSDAHHLSGYRLMWIFVMFDLPVGTKKQMRDATKFRELGDEIAGPGAAMGVDDHGVDIVERDPAGLFAVLFDL